VWDNTKDKVDLRIYVQRHGGKFPAGNWLTAVFNPQPGHVHTETWEKIRSVYQDTGSMGNAEARGIVAAIARYVMSIQKK
jgi:hypothetical protein